MKNENVSLMTVTTKTLHYNYPAPATPKIHVSLSAVEHWEQKYILIDDSVDI